MNDRHNKDLDDLLDSLVNDGDLDEKIDDFSQTRRQQEPEEEQVPESRQTDEPEQDIPAQSEGTMVFQRHPDSQPAPESGTVILNDGEIQQLIEEEKGPALRRETVSRMPESQVNWKMIGVAAGAVAIIALGGLLIFGISQAAGSLFVPADKTQDAASEDFSRLESFAKTYLSTQLQEITAYESIYNKLDADQQAEIDRILQERTGKTFAQILAEAKADKESASNNNTEIAEKKAQLRKQIADLQSQLTQAQSQLSWAQKDINDKLQAYNDAQAAFNQAQTDDSNAQAELASLQNQITSIQSQIDVLTAQPYENDEEAISIQNQVSDLYKQKNSLSAQLSQAQDKAGQTASALESASSALEAARQEYENVAGNAGGAQSQVDSITGQINSLQSQLDALN